jgi:hypothetical protein
MIVEKTNGILLLQMSYIILGLISGSAYSTKNYVVSAITGVISLGLLFCYFRATSQREESRIQKAGDEAFAQLMEYVKNENEQKHSL